MTTSAQVDALDPLTLNKFLSADRLYPYMVAARGNLAPAFNLYRWNIAASAAIYETLHLGEVVLRNAIDQQLRRWNVRPDAREPDVAHGADWTLDPCPKLERLIGDDLATARDRAAKAVKRSRSPRRPVTHGDVLAQLTLGTWRYLMPARTLRKSPTKRDLWNQALKSGFPHLPGDHTQLVDDVECIWSLRNRVAHLEPLIHPGLIEDGAGALRRVVASIDPGLCAWHDKQTRIEQVLKSRPVLPSRRSAPAAA